MAKSEILNFLAPATGEGVLMLALSLAGLKIYLEAGRDERRNVFKVLNIGSSLVGSL
jgi:hypothetical protein